ncbi:MAG: cupredoxin domain-containing protein [Candidatus Liptonbacteria bacterium]|nr:cupredoxin domain-containing protein [Candidatus Liptonbacteria bacterium]
MRRKNSLFYEKPLRKKRFFVIIFSYPVTQPGINASIILGFAPVVATLPICWKQSPAVNGTFYYWVDILGMHLKFTKLLLFIAIIAATIYLGNAVWRQYFVEEKIEEVVTKNAAIQPEQNLIPQENNIFVDEQQIAGDTINVGAVALLDSGFFTINSKGGGQILGSSTILKMGVYKNLTVKISNLPAGDNNLVARLYINNGIEVAAREFLIKKIALPKPEDLTAPYTPQDISINVIISDYEIIPKAIRANLGDRVTLNIKNNHSDYEIIIDKLDINAMIPAGKSSELKFTAKEAGVFRAFCPIKCTENSANSRNSIEVNYKKLNISG